MPSLREVFKSSGVPTFTFVKPMEFDRLLMALQTAGRGVIVEGPSGIGKTTSVLKGLEEIGAGNRLSVLSARKAEDRAYIAELPTMHGLGTVLIDDFHRLDVPVKAAIADMLKTLADEERDDTKLIVLGINKAGDSLIRLARDLNNRIDTIRLGTNPDSFVERLIDSGEAVLNISINTKKEIVADARGSFQIAQMLCYETCLAAGVVEQQTTLRELGISLDAVRETVLIELARAFFDIARDFSRGPKFRRSGRGPYLRLLNWLATHDEWALKVDPALAPADIRASLAQIIDKNHLQDFLNARPEIQELIHFDSESHVLSIEDASFLYYLRNLFWNKFSRQIGFITVVFPTLYDFALSFAGADRDLAEALTNRLESFEMSIFYDKNEQHRILAADVEEYLGPIYRSEAEFVVAILGKDYPKRIWTKFESEQFRQRFGDNSVIPVWLADAPPGMFDETSRLGGFTLDRSQPVEPQIIDLAETLQKKLAEVHAIAAAEGDPSE